MTAGKYIRTPEIRAKSSKSLSGRKMSESSKIKMSLAVKLRMRDPENRRKISEALSGPKSYRWKGGRPKCLDCGKVIYPTRTRCKRCASIEVNNRPEIKELRRQQFLGDRCRFWRGGLSDENKKIRHSYRMKDWRKEVFERDDFTCQVCRKRGVTLNAHHIKPFAKFPSLRFEITNGVTLCLSCHNETKSKEEWWEKEWDYLCRLDDMLWETCW